METMLGKISHAKLGFGGYQDAQFGLSLTFSGDGWGCGTFYGTWAERSAGAKWTMESQSERFADVMYKLRDLMIDAKVTDVRGLVGIPVECTFDDARSLSDWRILKEVL